MTDNIKYLEDGRAVRVLSDLPDGQHIVNLGYEDDSDEGVYFGTDKQVVGAVYDDPPAAALHEQVRKLMERRQEMQIQEGKLGAAIYDAQQRLKKLQAYKGLERIEDFLDGKLTHYVMWDISYSANDFPAPRVSTPQQEKCGDKVRERDLKLLTLFGKHDRTVEWKLNYYSDGSGSDRYNCIPCCSLEEAKAKATEILIDSIAKFQAKGSRNGNGLLWPPTAVDLLNSAAALDYNAPAWLHEIKRANDLANARSNVAETAKKHQEAMAKLQALEG